MKTYKHRLKLLLAILIALTLSACTRSPLPVESYQETGPQSSGSENGSSAQNGGAAADQPAVQEAFDQFTDRIFKETIAEDPLSLHFMLCNPENFGIEIPEMKFQPISHEELLKSAAEDKAILAELEEFDTTLLTSDQLFTYRMLQDNLETEERAEGLELFYQPLSPVIGVQAQLPVLMAEYTFYEKADVDRYLALLSQIDVYYAQLAEYEQEMADAGLAPSDATLDRIIQSCKDYLIRPENSFLTDTFNSRLDDLTDLSEEEKNEYKQQHLLILKEHFIPAYTNLSASLETLKGRGTNEKGLAHYENGKAYYEYLVSALTGTDSTVEELKGRITRQMGSDLAQVATLMQNNPNLETELSSPGYSVSEPVEILNHLREQIKKDFPALEDSEFEVKHVPEALESSLSPAFFLVPPLDSEETNVIYINDKSSQEQNLYTMLAHEGYPGHLYQSVYFNRTNNCPLRRLLTSGGYSEGWGLYCELYSYSFENGLSEDLQKVLKHTEATIYGLYALLDININFEGWDVDKTSEFLRTYYRIQDPEVVDEMYQALVENPGNYLKYYTGYLEISTMKESAQNTLGGKFDAKAFHQFILDMDGASFRVIKPYFQTWLLTYDLMR